MQGMQYAWAQGSKTSGFLSMQILHSTSLSPLLSNSLVRWSTSSNKSEAVNPVLWVAASLILLCPFLFESHSCSCLLAGALLSLESVLSDPGNQKQLHTLLVKLLAVILTSFPMHLLFNAASISIAVPGYIEPILNSPNKTLVQSVKVESLLSIIAIYLPIVTDNDNW